MRKNYYRTLKLSMVPLCSITFVIFLRHEFLPAPGNKFYSLSVSQQSKVNHSLTSDKLEFHSDNKFANLALKNGFKKFPESLVNKVTTLVYFIGPIRSSHSIIGSFIDAHKNAILADEFNLFHQLMFTPGRFQNKSDVVSALWEGSWLASNGGNREENFKGYNLKVEDLWNGFYENKVDLVGDKIGFLTLELYATYPRKFRSALNTLKEWFRVKTIFVVRNPFDNVATLTLYDHIKTNFKVALRGTGHIRKLKSSNACQNISEALVNDSRLLQLSIKKYTKWINQTHRMIEDLSPDLKIIFIKDFIRHPIRQMSDLCQFLNLKCARDFLTAVASKTFNSDSKSRFNIKWTRSLYREVDSLLDQYSQYFPAHSFFD